MSRFERQTILPGFGDVAQQKLRDARVLVIGAGGLGCPALLYLAAAGVGVIGIADGDVISVSNLNRQVLFGEPDVGKPKALTAADYLRRQYHDIRVEVIPEFLTVSNTLSVIERFDLVVDGSDNFATRYMVNDACVLRKRPLVFGAVYRNEGQVGVFNVCGEHAPAANYRDVYPDQPAPHEIPDCNEAGTLGVLPGIIGTMQAAEAIKLLTGYGMSLAGRMLFYNMAAQSLYSMEITPGEAGRNGAPADETTFLNTDYSVTCGTAPFTDWEMALSMLPGNDGNAMLVDVREPHEQPVLETIKYINIPVSALDQESHQLAAAQIIILFCKSGIRSIKAAYRLKKIFPGKTIYTIKGGIMHPMSPVNHGLISTFSNCRIK